MSGESKRKYREYNSIEYNRLGIVRGWPVFMVVTKNSYGIYDDYCKAMQDTMGLEVHICQKNSLTEAIKSIDKYHDYFFGTVGYPRTITKKNALINLL